MLLASLCRAETWVLVDTRRQTLTVLDDLRVLEHFDRVALGVAGAGIKHRRGDDKTPLGTFRVAWFNPAADSASLSG
ncbi:L,D-transpeptidase [Marinobacterium aestuariivivens]|uniref:L,D-transpeptidase n=1 Tax=Marinobacterium aestuariivivens TaxID=1698799 RepID=A0ABW1ZYK2_9GAMM